MQIVEKSIETLKVYENNARTHDDRQIKQIVDSIKTFGFNNPILVDAEGVIIAGHGRLAAAKALGLTNVPTVTLDHLTDAERKAYIIADNKIAANAGWDYSLLKLEFEQIIANGVEVELTGFGKDEIDAILQSITVDDTLADGEETVNPAYADSCVEEGDLWILGNHKLICGDSTRADVVAALAVSPILMVTDPPYGVNYDPLVAQKLSPCAGRALGKVLNDNRADWQEAYALFTGDIAYVWHAATYAHVVAQNLIDCGFEIVSQIIWCKDRFAFGRSDYHWQHEPAHYVVRKGSKHHWQGARDQATVWHISRMRDSDDNTQHSTQKPLECMLRPILNNTRSGDWVYDPFCGSGTTIIAAEKSGRRCAAVELSPSYCAASIERWQKLTGKQAVHAETGELYDSRRN